MVILLQGCNGIIILIMLNTICSAPPQICKSFQRNIVIAEGQDTEFVCVVQGFPAPSISWQHAGREVVNGDNPHFKVDLTETTDGYIVIVTSYLNLSSADNSVNGEVRCIADPPAPDLVGGITLDSYYTSTQLSVLGNLISLDNYCYS